jgi:hypothetical protein
VLPYRGLGNGIRRALREYPDIDFVDDPDSNLFRVVIMRPKADAGREAKNMEDVVAEVNRQIEENGKRFTWCDRTPRYYTLRSPIILGEMIEAIEFTKGDGGLYYPGGRVSLPWPDKATIESTADGFIIRDPVYNLHGGLMPVENSFHYRYGFMDG